MNKILTVSIANYNNASKLDRSISSLLDETILNDIEVIVVNDGSKDNSLEVINKYVDKYPNTVKVIDKQNGGYGSTINASLKIAKGKYYKLLDADDAYDTNNLIKYIEYLKTCDTDLVYTDFSFVNIGNGKKEYISFPYEQNKELSVSEIQKIHMHALTIKTELIQNKIDITEHCFYTDIEFSIKCMDKAGSFIYIPLEIYLYSIGDNEQSVSKAGYIKHAKEHETIIKKILEISHSSEKFNKLNKYHLDDLANDQLFIFMFDKKYKNDFYGYASYLKGKYPNILKKAKFYLKLSTKSKFLYNLFSKII